MEANTQSSPWRHRNKWDRGNDSICPCVETKESLNLSLLRLIGSSSSSVQQPAAAVLIEKAAEHWTDTVGCAAIMVVVGIEKNRIEGDAAQEWVVN